MPSRPLTALARSQEQTRLASLKRPLNGAALGCTKQRGTPTSGTEALAA